MISVDNGAKTISPVAVALAEHGIVVEGLTLRTPTLDDVFFEVTGERMSEEAPMTDDGRRPSRVAPRGAGFIAGSAQRRPAGDPPDVARPREPSCRRCVIPIFFFVVNVGALQKFVEGSFPARLRLQGVPTSRRRRLRGHRCQPRHVARASTSRTATSIGCC